MTGLGTQSYPGGPVRCVDSLGRVFNGHVEELADCGGSAFIDALSRNVLLGGIGGVRGAAGLLGSFMMS